MKTKAKGNNIFYKATHQIFVSTSK